ncbi:hypothetical protein BS17DRAFT_765202 [Gyrodon lividus]|nr:hypothetical protein BS17DRAFT_765202 [Gyrodon lividus]
MSNFNYDDCLSNDGNGNKLEPSQYHDNQGIQVLVIFTPLPMKSSAGEKRTHCLCPDNFTVKYTIPQSTYKDVDLASIGEFDTLVCEVQKQKNPLFKLVLTQTKREDDEVAEEEEILPHHKASAYMQCIDCKALKLNNEETKQDEHSTELSRLYCCKDHACRFPICWPAPPDAKHIHLMPMHLKTWEATIVWHCQATANPGTSVIVNNDFKELANVLLGDYQLV